MPRSEFTECKITTDGGIAVAGTVDAAEPVHVHWLVEQDGIAGFNVNLSDADGTFHGTDDHAKKWVAGQPATATAVQIGLDGVADGRPGLRTFTWSQTFVL